MCLGCTAAERLKLTLDLLLQLEDAVESRDASSCRFDETNQEELELLLEIVLLPHAHQVVVVKRAVSFEEIGQVQHWSLEDAFCSPGTA